MPDRVHVLGRNHQQDVAEIVRVWMPRRFHAEPDAADQRACGARGLVGDLARPAFEAEAGDDALVRVEAALDVEWLPRAFLLELGETAGELAGRAERRALDFAWTAAADVAHDQLDRAPDRRVGAIPLAEHVDTHVHADFVANRSVDDQDRRRAIGR